MMVEGGLMSFLVVLQAETKWSEVKRDLDQQVKRVEDEMTRQLALAHGRQEAIQQVRQPQALKFGYDRQ